MRLRQASRAVLEVGGQPHVIESTSGLDSLKQGRSPAIAIVALGEPSSSEDPGPNIVSDLTAGGFQVIAYEDGADAWPLAVRCRALLAGGSWLLDSGRPDFEDQLRRLLASVLKDESGRLEGEEHLRATMRRLGLVGQSAAMLFVFRWTIRVSRLSDLPVLITGETGTGKELIARAIHRLDLKRSHGPFVPLNCGALSPGLAESELFGHRRGAFTDAARDRRGLFRSAEGGVVFLDEIGDLDQALQGKLLRVLQENQVLGVGEDQEVPINVRVIAATHRDLENNVAEGRFRADLFHRLNVMSVRVQPLRDRPDDLQPTIEYLLEKYAFLAESEVPAAGPDFLNALRQLPLPGNVREVENIVRRALVNKADDSPLGLSDLPRQAWERLASPAAAVAADRGMRAPAQPDSISAATAELVRLFEANGWALARSLDQCERILVQAALDRARGNQTRTARLLGITPRSVYSKLHKYNITR